MNEQKVRVKSFAETARARLQKAKLQITAIEVRMNGKAE